MMKPSPKRCALPLKGAASGPAKPDPWVTRASPQGAAADRQSRIRAA